MKHDPEDFNRLIGQDFDTYEHLRPFWEAEERAYRAKRKRALLYWTGTTLLCWAVIVAALWWRFA